MNGRRSYYDVLGIERTASLPQVERAYRFCLEMYGDGALATYSLLDPGEQQEARERVREAYEVLRDPARRRAYDLSLAQPIFRPLREITPTAPPAAVPPLGVAPLPTTGATLAPAPVAPAPEPVAPEPPAPAPALSGPNPVALGEQVTGAALRRFREARGVSLDEIAQKSKISVRFLRYIEDERFEMLPAAVYLRGFLHEYARGVGLEPRGTAEAYLQRVPSI